MVIAEASNNNSPVYAILGATGGIGGAVARALHAQGATVTLSGTKAEKLEGLAAELKDRVHIATCNLSDLEAVDALPKIAAEKMGALQIVVSNAGVTRDMLMMMMKPEMWDEVIRVNLTAYFRLSKASLRFMTKQRFGRIIGITSVVGVTGNAGQANYAASKAGMHGFSISLAQENAKFGITVNTVSPGYVATDMVMAVPEEVRAKIAAQIPVGRLGKPEEIAYAVGFLVAEEAAWITGANLSINGGHYMGW